MNTKFIDDYVFCLPLTSRHLLILTDRKSPKPLTIEKLVISGDLVRTMNLYACQVINERIIGIRKEELDELTKFIKSWTTNNQ